MQSCRQEFIYKTEDEVNSVALVGDFNAWSPNNWALTYSEEDEAFVGRFTIAPGTYTYRLMIDGEEKLDPRNSLTLYGRDGREHSCLIQEDCKRPAVKVQSIVNESGTYSAELSFFRAENGSPLDPTSVQILLDGEKSSMDVDVDSGSLHVEVSPQTGKHRLIVQASDADGLKADELIIPFWIEEQPFSWKDAIIYQIVVDRFARGGSDLDRDAAATDRMGGDYAGIIEAIESGYFDQYGVNALWLSPANTNVDGSWTGFDGRMYESYHGYWPVAPRQVDDRWGGAEELDRLVQTAHGNGIRVMLDVVMNHVHREHPYFIQQHELWFNHPDGNCVCGRECSWMTDIENCWFTDYLPDLDWREADVVDALVADSAWWLERFDLDALRLDAVAMMPRLATRHLRREADKVAGRGGSHVYLIGETFTGSDGRDQIRQTLGPQGLSGQFDFPVMWSLRRVIAEGQGEMPNLLDEVDRSLESWSGSGAVMGLILGNHDVARFLSLAAGDKVDDTLDPPPRPDTEEPYSKLALANVFLMSQAGAAVIYYGDEYGMAGGGDPDNRRPMNFESDWTENEKKLAGRVSKMARLRSLLPALRSGMRRDLLREEDHIAYSLGEDEDAVLVILSREAEANSLKVPYPSNWSGDLTRDLRDCFGTPFTLEDGKIAATIPPYGAMILVKKEVCDALEH